MKSWTEFTPREIAEQARQSSESGYFNSANPADQALSLIEVLATRVAELEERLASQERRRRCSCGPLECTCA